MEHFYQLLERIGYLHPVHPPFTHMPAGLVIGSFLLGVVSLLFRSQSAGRAARYCMLMVFISVFVTALFGYMDWQHFYAGGWIRALKFKLVLAPILLVLSATSPVRGGRTRERRRVSRASMPSAPLHYWVSAFSEAKSFFPAGFPWHLQSSGQEKGFFALIAAGATRTART